MNRSYWPCGGGDSDINRSYWPCGIGDSDINRELLALWWR